MDDLFASMFGGGGAGGSFYFDTAGPGQQRRKPTRGQDTIVEYDISLEDAYKGKKVVMALERDRVCSHCTGTGARTGAKPSTCTTCEGRGSVTENRHVRAELGSRYGADDRWARDLLAE